MPNIKSAAKRLRQTVKRTLWNRMRKSRVKTAEALFTELLAKKKDEAFVAQTVAAHFPVEAKAAKEAGKTIDANTAIDFALSKCFSELDKAAKKGVIHPNKADRKKSRLTAMVAKQA